MQNGEKNKLLDILRTNNLVNRMGFIGQGNIDLGQAVTWNAAANGVLSLGANVSYNLTFTGDVYGLTVYASTIALGVASSFIALTFNPAISFQTDDVYTVSGIDLTISD